MERRQAKPGRKLKEGKLRSSAGEKEKKKVGLALLLIDGEERP